MAGFSSMSIVVTLFVALAIPLASAGAARPGVQTAPVTFVGQWGSYGSGPGQLRWPEQIAFDHEGNLWVADHGNDRIQKFTAEGHFLSKFGVAGFQPGKTTRPIGVAIAPDGNVYVSEAHPNQRIQEFTPSGVLVRNWGHWGSCHGEFLDAEFIAVDGTGAVYVGDSGNDRIQKFTGEGAFVTTWGSFPGCDPGDWEGGLSVGGVLVAGSGNVYVGNGRMLEEYTPDGTLVRQVSCLVNVSGIAEDPNDGTLYVAGGLANEVQMFSADGTSLGTFGETGNGPGQFNAPVGVAVDGSGFIYVGDLENHRIQKFARSGAAITSARSSTWGRVKTLYR